MSEVTIRKSCAETDSTRDSGHCIKKGISSKLVAVLPETRRFSSEVVGDKSIARRRF